MVINRMMSLFMQIGLIKVDFLVEIKLFSTKSQLLSDKIQFWFEKIRFLSFEIQFLSFEIKFSLFEIKMYKREKRTKHFPFKRSRSEESVRQIGLHCLM